mmetsp:Transcript_18408/g.39330  ORF Transcript_18408/g.39330 Transcript_18408/m.39330 type:complete len:319 (+) Transcript_18408:1625-2581(+)
MWALQRRKMALLLSYCKWKRSHHFLHPLQSHPALETPIPMSTLPLLLLLLLLPPSDISRPKSEAWSFEVSTTTTVESSPPAPPPFEGESAWVPAGSSSIASKSRKPTPGAFGGGSTASLPSLSSSLPEATAAWPPGCEAVAAEGGYPAAAAAGVPERREFGVGVGVGSGGPRPLPLALAEAPASRPPSSLPLLAPASKAWVEDSPPPPSSFAALKASNQLSTSPEELHSSSMILLGLQTTIRQRNGSTSLSCCLNELILRMKDVLLVLLALLHSETTSSSAIVVVAVAANTLPVPRRTSRRSANATTHATFFVLSEWA